MQLFVTQPIIQGTTIHIQEDRVLAYMGRVLRMKAGDICYIQREGDTISTRWEIEITEITKKQIVGEILDCKKNVKYLSNVSLLIALPNKFSKLELLVQKCTEAGVDSLYFRSSQRSLLKEITGKKMERLLSIALESVEQCKRWSIPELHMLHSNKDLTMCLEEKEIIVFDFVEDNSGAELAIASSKKPILGIVGAEGHFTDSEFGLFKSYGYTPMSLGNHILRTETAAIIGGWNLVRLSGLKSRE